MAPKIDYSMRFPDDEFFPAARKKTGIAIHHTVGGTGRSTFNYWLKDRTKAGKRRVVGTAFIIDRDGRRYCQLNAAGAALGSRGSESLRQPWPHSIL